MGRTKKSKKKNVCFLAVLAAASLCLGGCGRIELPRGREEETLALVDCSGASVSVSRTFTIPAGQQGVLTADYRQGGGSAGIALLKGEVEVAALSIPESGKKWDVRLEEGAAKSEKGTAGVKKETDRDEGARPEEREAWSEERTAGLEDKAVRLEDGAAETGGGEGSVAEHTVPERHGTMVTVLDCGVYTVKVESETYRGTVKCTLVRKEKDFDF